MMRFAAKFPCHARRRSVIAWCTVVALTTMSNAADAQTRRDTPLPARLSPATRSAIERLADSLNAERLPGYALRDKAAEGVLKGADDARVWSAVSSLASRLRESRAVVGPQGTDSELLASASAIYSGIAPDALVRMVRAQRGRDANSSLTMPLTVAAAMASRNVPTDLVVSAIDALLSKGARDAELGAFGSAVEREMNSGFSAREAVTRSIRRFPQ